MRVAVKYTYSVDSLEGKGGREVRKGGTPITIWFLVQLV